MHRLFSDVTRRRIFNMATGLAATSALAGLDGVAAAKVPFLGSIRPLHERFKLSAFEVTTILDAAAMIDGPWPIVGEDRTKSEVAQLMRANLLPEHRFEPGFTPTLVNTGRELLLFDTGNGTVGFVPPPAGGWLAAQLAPAGFKADQIDMVVLTHGHTDHIGGLFHDGRPAFPNARYVIGDTEANFWMHADRLSAPAGSYEHKSAALFRAYMGPLAERTRFVKPGDEIVSGVCAVRAYGHTPGHLAYHVESQGCRLLIWGDCAHHQVASLARPDWHALFDMDKAQGAATRRAIYAMAAQERLPVIGYHMPFPSLGFVETAGLGYRWLPNSYQLT